MKIITSIIFLFVGCISFSQSLEWKGNFSVAGIVTSEDSSPFWIAANANSQYGLASNFSGLGAIQGNYAIDENNTLEFGAAFFYRDNLTDEFARRDLYLEYQNNWLKATVGAKKTETKLQGLSTSNKNFLLSQNARPLGGLLIEAPAPLSLSKTISLDWGIGHFITTDHRFVEDVKVHYKRLGLEIRIDEKNTLNGQIQHYAQWGGTSPEFGDLPDGFGTFTDVFLAKGASDSEAGGEIQNAVGNHLGSYLFEYTHSNTFGLLQFYHEHPFEDGSGTAFKNLPDGVWGAYFAPTNKKVISGLLYEYVHTNNQSVGNQAAGADNYFSNNIYRSGWTYDGFVLGTPFVLVNFSSPITEDTSPIISNRAKVHHIGIAGSFKKIDWTLKTSLATHLGTYNNPFEEELSLWNNYFSLMYTTKTYGVFRLFGAIDTGKLIDTSVGVGLEYSYSF